MTRIDQRSEAGIENLTKNAFEIGKISAKGSFQLFLGIIVSNLIMAVGTILVGRLLSPSEYGIYSVALIPSLMINLFRDWGVNSAMTKYIAEYRAEGKTQNLEKIIVAGVTFEVAVGLVLSLVSLFLASYIASTFFHRPESASFIAIVSVTIFSGALLTASQSCFVGFERMGLSSFIMVCQSIVKSVVSPVLVVVGYAASGAVLGYTFSFLIAGLLGILMLYFMLFRRLRKAKTSSFMLSDTLRTMLRYGLPLSVSVIIGGFLVQLYNFMMALYCSDLVIGNFYVSVNFAVVLTFFTFPISTVLLPAFSKLDSSSERQLLKTIFQSSVKYTALLTVPATAAVMALSKPMIYTLFGETYVYAPSFLTLYVISFLLTGLGNLSLINLLAGLGETRMRMKMSLLTLVFGLILAFILIPTYGIVGVIVANLIMGIPSLFWGLSWVWQHYGVTVNWWLSLRIFLGSAVAAAIAHAATLLNAAEWIKLLIGAGIFVAIYIIVAPLAGVINKTDIASLRTISSGLGFISSLLSVLFSMAEGVLAAKIRFADKIRAHHSDT